MTRYRALLGCATIAAITVLGLPSLTEAATAGTQPPTTEVVAGEATSDQQTVDPVGNADAPVPPAPTETVPGEPQDEPVVPPAESAASEPAPVEPATGEPTTDGAASSTDPLENASPAATESSGSSAADTTTPDTTTPETTVPDVAEVATAGTATAAVTPSAASDAPNAEVALNTEEPSISLMAAAPQVYSVSATQTEDDYGTMKYRNVTVSWSGTSDASYEVERRLSTSSSWEWVGSSWDGSTSITDTFYDWSTFGWYQYRVTPSSYDYDTYTYVAGSPSYVSVNVTRVAYAPSLPRSVRVARTSTTAQVTWTAPTTADYACESTGYYFCDAATSYIVSWAPAGGTWQSLTTTSTSRTLTGLGSGTTYYVNVRAVNAAGQSGATTSVRVAALTVPSVPQSLTATPGYNQMTLRWAAPASNGGAPITGYTISYAPAGGTWTSVNVSASALSRTITGLRGGTTFYFRIEASNAAGYSAATTSVAAKPMAPIVTPTAPRQPTATPGVGRVTLRWVGPASPGASAVTRQVIQQSRNGINWATTTTTLAATARSYTVTSLSHGVRYYFRIAMVNASGQGAWSATTSAVTPNRPGTPRYLDADDPSWPYTWLTFDAPTSNGGSAITGYVIQRSIDGGTWVTVHDGIISMSSYYSGTLMWRADGLALGHRYSFRVAARNAVGIGPYAGPVGATAITVPGAPSWLNSSASYGGFSLTWGAPASSGGSPITDYVVQYSFGGSWTTVYDGRSTARSAWVSLPGYGCADLRVYAVNAAGGGGSRDVYNSCYWG